jgi:hypothetical protein
MATVVTKSETKSENAVSFLPSVFIHPVRKSNLVPFQRDIIQFYANLMG